MSKDLRIVYLGTPDFAVESLDILVRNNYNVVGVVTMPDKPAGRGHKLQYSPVKKYALEHDLPILQPANLKDPDFIEELKELKADLQVVVAFRMLPEMVWNMPPMGTINVHASLLPQYRGAAPIHHAVINGDSETGVSTFQLKHEIDTGAILLQKKLSISATDTTGVVHDKLMVLGAEALLETVEGLSTRTLKGIPQEELFVSEAQLKKAPKIFKDFCQINWNNTANDIYNKIRGLNPFPGAFCKISVIDSNKDPKNLKLFSSEIELKKHDHQPGEILFEGNKKMKIACQDGYVIITELQLAGKKRMKTDDFLKGFDLHQKYLAL